MPSFIINIDPHRTAYVRFVTRLLTLAVFVLAMMSVTVSAKRIAVLAPDATDASTDFAAKLGSSLAVHFKILDNSMSQAAWASAAPATPFNLSAEQAKTIGISIGCDFFVLVRSATLRRSAYQRAEYYESYAAVFVVSTRTGHLVLWKLLRFEAAKPADSAKSLTEAITPAGALIAETIRAAIKAEIAEPDLPAMEEPPADPPPATNFRAPVPYRRIKPEYTTTARLYDVAATVEIHVDLDAAGEIKRTQITRWGGYGLDESVEKTVREMNWRPAERNGKTLPMRFLLRYNFKKIEKE